MPELVEDPGAPVVEDEATAPSNAQAAVAGKEHAADEDAQQRKWSAIVLRTLQDLATRANVASDGGLALVLIVAAFGGWGFATSAVEETLPTAAPSEATTAEPFEFDASACANVTSRRASTYAVIPAPATGMPSGRSSRAGTARQG